MHKVSIIIPARNEKYLNRTLENLYQNATGDFEVIVGLNGKTEYPINYDYPNLEVYHELENIGLKPMINKLASRAKGKYIYKSDAHCAFGKGFNEILQEGMQDDWVVTPRFKIIKQDWSIQQRDGQEEFYDYFYLCCPFTDKRGIRFKAGGHWPERTKERLESHPGWDETPQMHGSGWFMSKKYYFDTLSGFPEDDWDGHAQEPIWLGLKNWLIGGKLMVNKKTWYAHLHQDSKDRGYPEDRNATERTYNLVANHFLLNKEFPKYPNSHLFSWFVEKFEPMPSWPNNWRDLYNEYLRLHN